MIILGQFGTFLKGKLRKGVMHYEKITTYVAVN